MGDYRSPAPPPPPKYCKRTISDRWEDTEPDWDYLKENGYIPDSTKRPVPPENQVMIGGKLIPVSHYETLKSLSWWQRLFL